MPSGEAILAVIGGSVGLVTMVWHAAMYVGKLTNKVERLADRVDDHEDKLRDLMGMGG